MELGFDPKKILDNLKLDDLKSKIKLDQNTTVMISVVIIALTVAIWWNFIKRIEVTESKNLQEEIESAEFRNEVGRVQSVLDEYESKIPRVSDVSWLLDRVVEVADMAQIRLTFFEPQAKEQFDKYARISVRIKAFTTYHDLGVFIGMIESANRFMRIDGIKVRNDVKTGAGESELLISALVILEGQ